MTVDLLPLLTLLINLEVVNGTGMRRKLVARYMSTSGELVNPDELIALCDYFQNSFNNHSTINIFKSQVY